jgi:hypothetical protein
MFKRAALATVALLAMATAAQAAAPKIGTVFYIAMENHNWVQPSGVSGINQIYGNSAAPFINSLVTAGNPNAAMVSFASNYQNVSGIHPSEPNYVWMEAGKAGPLNDANPYPSNIVSGPNLSAQLAAKGQSWKSYQEDTDLLTAGGLNVNSNHPAGVDLTNNVAGSSQYSVPLTSFSGTSADYTNAYNGSHQYNYAAKHNPQVFFTSTNGGNDPTSANSQSQNYAPLQQLQSDLNNNTVGRYNFITPDQYNDMHSSLATNFVYNGVTYTPGDEQEIAMGDNFLSQVVPMIEASDAFQNNGEIVIWNDETEKEGSVPGLFSSMEIVISPLAKGNAYTNNIQYTHTNDLATLDAIFGTSPQGAAMGAYTMSDLYKAGAVPEPATWGLMLTGFAGLGGLLRRRRRETLVAA